LNGSTKKQEFFGQGGFTSIWVGNNAEGAAFLGGFCESHGGNIKKDRKAVFKNLFVKRN
jgi:hypothetical protein